MALHAESLAAEAGAVPVADIFGQWPPPGDSPFLGISATLPVVLGIDADEVDLIADERASNCGISCSQTVHHEAKNATTVGFPAKSARVTRPSSSSAGRSHASSDVSPTAGEGQIDTRNSARSATTATPPPAIWTVRCRESLRRFSSANFALSARCWDLVCLAISGATCRRSRPLWID